MANKKGANRADSTLFAKINSLQEEAEKAICFSVCLTTKGQTEAIVEASLDELSELANTAGAEVLAKIYQKRAKIDSRYYIGAGKLEEIKVLAEQVGAN